MHSEQNIKLANTLEVLNYIVPPDSKSENAETSFLVKCRGIHT
jgi:hypothetical protein